MSTTEVIGPRGGSAPLTYPLTELGTVDLQSVFASFDGAGASGSWLAALTIRAQDGSILVRVFPSETLGAGDSADVTFGPFLGRDSGAAGGGGTLTLLTFNGPGVRTVANGTSRLYAPQAGTLDFVEVNLGTPATGADFVVRVNKNGASIGTGTVAAGTYDTTFVPTDTAVADGDYFTVDVTQVGATVAGSDVVVQFVGTWA